MRKTKCQACGSRRLCHLERLHEFLRDCEDDPWDGDGVWVGRLPYDGPKLLRFVGGAEVGEISAIVCADCGYVDLYVKESWCVPWDELVKFRRRPTEKRCFRCSGGRTGWLSTATMFQPNLGFVPVRRPRYLFFLPRMVEPVGRLLGLVCSDCGYLATFADEPDQIPWHRLLDFQRLKEAAAGPCAACGGTAMGSLSPVGHAHTTLAMARGSRFHRRGIGELRGIVCQRCGHLETFVRDVDEMPWSALMHSKWL